MTPDRWRQIEALYRTAQNCEAAERVALLDRADPEIRSVVERMLEQKSGSRLLDPPLADFLDTKTKTTIAPGAQLGLYRIQAQIGAGGMGTVYRAIDTRLDRVVAIKIAAERYSERFQIEARVISTLNHPHICTLHDVGPDYLVMEFIEGSTLAEEIAKGPMDQERVVRYGSQIASALAEAHAHDIVHRDLKPGNVMVTRHGVKVLDFGLAKMVSQDGITETNAIMGTPAYMAPEQMQGRECDARTDIYALGLVLAEMATGKRTIPGGRPQLDSLPRNLAHVVERCLAENPEDRWQNARDVKAELEWAAKPAPAAVAQTRSAGWRRALPWALAGAAMAGLALFAWLHRTDRRTVPAEPVRLQIPLAALHPTGALALSPDGKQLAFIAKGTDGVQKIWVRALNSLEIRALPDTESVSALLFWSPDSRFIAFDSDGKLRKINVAGGPPETICTLGKTAVGGSWSKQGAILFGQFGGPIMQVPAAGGVATPVTVMAASRGDVAHTQPRFLPDGRHFIYSRDLGASNEISTGSVDVKPENQDYTSVAAIDLGAAYSPGADSDAGLLLFTRGETLLSQPFDASRLKTAGESVRVIDAPLAHWLDTASFSVSANGTLAYWSPGNTESQLTWFDAQGKILGHVGEPANYSAFNMSPDGKQALVTKRQAGEAEFWRFDVTRGTSTRFDLNSPMTMNASAVWALDGKSIIFSSILFGKMLDLFRKQMDGTSNAEELLRSNEAKWPTSWSADGRFLLYYSYGGKTLLDLWVLPLFGSREPVPFLRTQFDELDGRFSPDGRWVAYTSNESGRYEVYVRSFSPNLPASGFQSGDNKWLISQNGGGSPRWSQDGKELYYIEPGGKVMSVRIGAGSTFQADVPRVLFQGVQGVTQWAPSPDGKRFLFLAPKIQDAAPITVVLNWQAGLKR